MGAGPGCICPVCHDDHREGGPCTAHVTLTVDEVEAAMVALDAMIGPSAHRPRWLKGHQPPRLPPALTTLYRQLAQARQKHFNRVREARRG